MPPKPIEKATIRDLRAWLSDEEADRLDEAGHAHRIPTWPITQDTVVAALRRVGIANPEPMLTSVDATLTYLQTHTRVFTDWVLVIRIDAGSRSWVQFSPSINADVYVWAAESDSPPLALAVLALCVLCYRTPKNGFDDGYFFRAPLTPTTTDPS